jgi:hypothetical protein
MPPVADFKLYKQIPANVFDLLDQKQQQTVDMNILNGGTQIRKKIDKLHPLYLILSKDNSEAIMFNKIMNFVNLCMEMLENDKRESEEGELTPLEKKMLGEKIWDDFCILLRKPELNKIVCTTDGTIVVVKDRYFTKTFKGRLFIYEKIEQKC